MVSAEHVSVWTEFNSFPYKQRHIFPRAYSSLRNHRSTSSGISCITTCAIQEGSVVSVNLVIELFSRFARFSSFVSFLELSSVSVRFLRFPSVLESPCGDSWYGMSKCDPQCLVSQVSSAHYIHEKVATFIAFRGVGLAFVRNCQVACRIFTFWFQFAPCFYMRMTMIIALFWLDNAE